MLLVCAIFVLAFAPAAALHHQEVPAPPLEAEPGTFYMLPEGYVLCLQGDQAYLQAALERLKDSNMEPGWRYSKIEPGTCASLDYKQGPLIEHCFPKAEIWSDGDPNHNKGTMDEEFVTMYNLEHTEIQYPKTYPLIQCMYEVEEAHASKTTHHIIPNNGYVCMEGPGDYMHLSLKHLQESNMQTGWTKTKVEDGPCKEAGFPKRITEQFDGAELKHCFPKARIYSDDKPEHALAGMNMLFVQEYNEKHPGTALPMPVIECMDRVGSIF